MKTAKDPRHLKRRKTIKVLFAYGFTTKTPKNKVAEKIIKNQKKIDQIITRAAPEWPLAQINRIDLAILRLAVYELLVAPQEPPKVIIDEAVELAKRYGSEKSASFINGVLGTIFKKNNGEKKS